MPLTLPNLDDRSYRDLVEEARALIPTVAPKWTNHNPSDPGIMLIELFAYLSEMLIYRLDQVPTANLAAFLKLLQGGLDKSPQPGQTMNDEIRETVAQLRERDRAVTCEDFEMLALAAEPQRTIARAHCIPNCDLESAKAASKRPGHVSVIIVPRSKKEPTPAQLALVKEYLEPRRLLTTWVHVVQPSYLELNVRMRLHLMPDAVNAQVRKVAERNLQSFFDPLTGGPACDGWPFGRAVYVSEIYQLLDTLPGIDYVEKDLDKITKLEVDELALVSPDPSRMHYSEYEHGREKNRDLFAVELQAHELVLIKEITLTIVSPSAH